MDGQPDPHIDEWGPLGRPLFDDPSARALERVGVVDVGSNSVRLVVFDGAARSPAYFYNEKILCGLGADMASTGRLNATGRVRALSAIKRFALLARAMKVEPITMVATAAVRDAADGPEFRGEVEAATGLHMWVIDGEEEARLSAQGVLLGWPEAKGIVSDIGGSSMELAVVGDGAVGRRLTSPLGPLKVQGVKRSKKALKAHIREVIDDLAAQMGTDHGRLYLVGGSWRAFARLDMARRGYPLHVLHEYRMRPRAVQKTAAWIAQSDIDELRAETGNSAARMALVPVAAQVLSELVRRLKPNEIFVSSYGIREGMLYEQMPAKMRHRDPLIEAARFAEQKDARMPGFGKRLFQFIEPLYRNAPPARLRLVRAACYLHDVSWRAHPDYRAQVCFDAATRANLGGLDHEGRVFLAVALLHRYKNNRSGTGIDPLLELLPERALDDAEVLGKAMRFGAMFAVDDVEKMGRLTWQPKKRVLSIRLNRETADLFGEVAEARFQSLAKAMQAEAVVKR